ncbi:hypothetical protein HKX48_001540 [Thoreauomyces humboldtii]|nr:hypothetical protein HKX48_001540 [Thoreauomyces humboldtii]
MPIPPTEGATAILSYIDNLNPSTTDVAPIREYIKADATAVFWRNANGATLLHLVAGRGNTAAATELLRAGAAWNAVDDSGRSVGEFAKEAGFDDLYDFLVQEGVRTEYILMALGAGAKDAYDSEDEADGVHASDAPEAAAADASGKVIPEAIAIAQASVHPSNADYLSRRLTFSQGRLLDSDANAVMMGWEAPLMDLHAAVIAPRPGLSVLNVGFGLGLIDTALQALKPEQHTIIEAHPDVYAKMLLDGWDKKPGVRILFGRWQDVLGDLKAYDGIFFDTFGEYYDDLKEFHEHLPNILSQDGIYSFFNGLAGTNAFFHDVACGIAETDLREMGLDVKFREIPVDELGDETWQGVKRAYFSLPTYRLPICNFEEY